MTASLLFVTVPFSRINACTQRGLLVYFQPAEKKGLVICTYNHICYITKLSLHWSVTKNLYILQRLRHHWHCSEWVHPCFCPKADWFTYASATELRMLLRASHAGGLAICLACPDLAIDPKSRISSTYQSHWYTSQNKTTQQHSNYKWHIFSFIWHSLRQVEDGLLDNHLVQEWSEHSISMNHLVQEWSDYSCPFTIWSRQWVFLANEQYR
jgi:hypothetical protein